MPSSFGLMPVACMSGSEPQMERMLRMTSASAEVPARVIAVSTCPCRAIASASVASGMQPGPTPTTMRATGNSLFALAIVSATACRMLANDS